MVGGTFRCVIEVNFLSQPFTLCRQFYGLIDTGIDLFRYSLGIVLPTSPRESFETGVGGIRLLYIGPEGIFPIMAYTGRLRPKGVPFSGVRYIKG